MTAKRIGPYFADELLPELLPKSYVYHPCILSLSYLCDLYNLYLPSYKFIGIVPIQCRYVCSLLLVIRFYPLSKGEVFPCNAGMSAHFSWSLDSGPRAKEMTESNFADELFPELLPQS